NQEYASTTRFKNRIAHGMLSASFICTVLGTKMPGIGTIHIGQELQFIKPVYIGDTISVRLEIIEILEKSRMKISSKVYNQHGELTVDGISLVKAPTDEV